MVMVQADRQETCGTFGRKMTEPGMDRKLTFAEQSFQPDVNVCGGMMLIHI